MAGQTMGAMTATIKIQALRDLEGRLIAVLFRIQQAEQTISQQGIGNSHREQVLAHGSARLCNWGVTALATVEHGVQAHSHHAVRGFGATVLDVAKPLRREAYTATEAYKGPAPIFEATDDV